MSAEIDFDLPPLPTVDPERDRAEYINGLRLMAGFLEAHPEAAIPYRGYAAYCHCDSVESFAERSRALMDGGRVEKEPDETWFMVKRAFGPHSIVVYAARSTVCERREVGRETVEVPDPEAPKVTVTRPVYEWDCKPILAHLEEVPS